MKHLPAVHPSAFSPQEVLIGTAEYYRLSFASCMQNKSSRLIEGLAGPPTKDLEA